MNHAHDCSHHHRRDLRRGRIVALEELVEIDRLLHVERANPAASDWEGQALKALTQFQLAFRTQQSVVSRELAQIMVRYHKDVVKTVGEFYRAGGATLTSGQQTILDVRLRTLINGYTSDLRNYMQTATLSTAELRALHDAQFFTRTLGVALPEGLRDAFANPFTHNALAKKTHEILWKTALGNEVSLSNKLWALGEHSMDRVSQITRAGMQAGLHPIKLAKALEAELVPLRSPGRIWSGTRGPERLRGLVRAAPEGLRTRRGTVAYNYLRIARTETWRAQLGAHLLRANFFNQMPNALNPVQGIRWNLSTSHEIEDICDEWATDDKYDLGGGVFPPDAVPLGHPNCLCNTSTELMPPQQFQRQLVDFVSKNNMSDRDVQRTLTMNAGRFLSTANRATMFGPQFGRPGKFTPDIIQIAAQRGVTPSSAMKLRAKGIEPYRPLPAKETQDMFLNPNGEWAAERANLHDRIMADFFKNTQTVPEGEAPVFHMLGGGPATGKSSVTNAGLINTPKNAVKIDADAIKGKLPEYKQMVKNRDGRAASFVHEESSHLTTRLTAEAYNRNTNVILDGTGDGNYAKFVKKIGLAREKGYRVVADYMTCDIDQAVRQANLRAIKTGRFVPESVIRETHISVSDVFPRAIKDGLFDEARLWDTTIKGQPRLIFEVTSSGQKIVHDKALYKKFLDKAKESKTGKPKPKRVRAPKPKPEPRPAPQPTPAPTPAPAPQPTLTPKPAKVAQPTPEPAKAKGVTGANYGVKPIEFERVKANGLGGVTQDEAIALKTDLVEKNPLAGFGPSKVAPRSEIQAFYEHR